jgi:prepilin-type N-terminal cleavage/methylation domain-containing protein
VKKKLKYFGFSLVELIVVLGILAALAALAIPGIKAMQKSFDSTGADSMISTALSTARTLAIKNQRYAGLRFQKAYDSNDQYMIFIVNDNDIRKNMKYIFRAIEGYKPIKLPECIGVIDLKLDDDPIVLNDNINEEWELTDTTTFSIVFSPSGKLAIHDIEVRNRDGGDDNDKTSDDEIFNTYVKVTDSANPAGKFLQDYNPRKEGLGREQSRKNFIIYEREKFDRSDTNQRFDYLKTLKPNCLNPYTGEILKK